MTPGVYTFPGGHWYPGVYFDAFGVLALFFATDDQGNILQTTNTR
jgi:hypothetical protein